MQENKATGKKDYLMTNLTLNAYQQLATL